MHNKRIAQPAAPSTTCSTHTAYATKYAILRDESFRYGERNDCTVIATAMLFDLTYNEAHKKLFDLGRRARCGFNMYILETMMSHRLAAQVTKPKQPNGSSYTVSTITNHLVVGKYLVYTSGHVLACINGQIYDWTADRKHRVKSYVEVDSIMDLL